MTRPIVAIVGRPNVGKSTLFNRITGERTAIVEGQPGVTRDRIYGDAHWLNTYFTVIDTGGIDWEEDVITRQVRQQALLAVEEADVIIFMVDGRSGLTGVDEEIADILRRSSKPVILCVNKVESTEQAWEASVDFYSLGLGDPILISAEHGRNVGDLLDAVVAHFRRCSWRMIMKIAIVGRPSGQVFPSEQILGRANDHHMAQPGMPLAHCTFQGQKLTLIDTAGRARAKWKSVGIW